MMINETQLKTVWQWLDERGYVWDSFYEGFRKHNIFISQNSCYTFPGDVIYFLKTGFVRNIKIFDTGWFQPTPESLGYKAHKDGRCVSIRRVK